MNAPFFSPRAGFVRDLIRGPARFARKAILPRILPAASKSPPRSIGTVRVVGLLSSSSGLGMSARLCIDALERDGASVTTHDVSSFFAAGAGIEYRVGGPFPAAGELVSIYHLNPPKLLPGLIRSDLRRYYRSYNIGYWAWELEALPAEWVEAIRFVDAIMVPSTFCRDAVAQYTRKPVLVVPHPVAGGAATVPRPREGPFQVLNVFSFGSSFERKNPLALVHAFRAAFGEAPDVRLVLKTSGGDRYPNDLAVLRAAVGDAANIVLIDEIWSPERLAAAFASADLYASLHRSEGFGLTIAEAIMAGIPVVATGWSGNTDFCDPDLAYTVAHSLVPFADTHPDYEGVGAARWAEPCVEDAARQLRAVRADPEAARLRASKLKEAVRAFLARNTYARALDSLAAPAPEGVR